MHLATYEAQTQRAYDKVHWLRRAIKKVSTLFRCSFTVSNFVLLSLVEDAIKRDMIPGCQTFLKGLKVKGQKSLMDIGVVISYLWQKPPSWKVASRNCDSHSNLLRSRLLLQICSFLWGCPGLCAAPNCSLCQLEYLIFWFWFWEEGGGGGVL